MGSPAVSEDMPHDEMVAKAVAHMQKHPGLYWLSDARRPGFAAACLSFNGTIHQLKMDGELKPDGFFEHTRISGPLPPPK